MAEWYRGVVVFVPLFNEREKIRDVLERTVAAAGNRLCALVVADDASTDGSFDIAREITPHVVRLPVNTGNGAVTRAALRYIREHFADDVRAVVRIDGDGQHDPDRLPGVIAQLEAGCDVVTCSRFHEMSSQEHAPLDRKCLNGAMAQMVRTVTGWPVSDARTGFLGFRWEAVAPVIDALRVDRYGIPIELLLRVWASRPDLRFKELPHPALYQRGISARLDAKYACEDVDARVARLTEAYGVFLRTCEELGVR